MNVVRRLGQAAATTAVSLTVAVTLPVTAAHADCDPNYPPEECKPPVAPVVMPFHIERPPVASVQSNEFNRPPATNDTGVLPFTGAEGVLAMTATGAALVIAGGMTLVVVRRRRSNA